MGIYSAHHLSEKLLAMNTLYQDLSTVYEAMYQSFIDYDEEATFYGEILKSYRCKSVLEIGCGTGHLAERLSRQGLLYQGLDYSSDMLKIARDKNSSFHFIEGDMRNFRLSRPVSSAIITGRTISYLITNQDLMAAFSAIHQQLDDHGMLVFDFIDANAFIPQIDPQKRIVHSATFENQKYYRDSYWSLNLSQSWTFDWSSHYFQADEQDLWQKIGEDFSTIRTFCKDDIALFLTLAGFEIKAFIPRPAYAFDTFVAIAQKTITPQLA
jgi:SAM-dependent methyltransferase